MARIAVPITGILTSLLLIGSGCTSGVPANDSLSKTVGNVAGDPLERCRNQTYVKEFNRLFGEGNVTPTSYQYSDDYRTSSNTCTYIGYVAVDAVNYFFSVSAVTDPEQNYFKWERNNLDAGQILLPAKDLGLNQPEPFYKKLKILSAINFGQQRQQIYGWDLIAHADGLTYSLKDMPQFEDVGDGEMENVLRAVLHNLYPKVT